MIVQAATIAARASRIARIAAPPGNDADDPPHHAAAASPCPSFESIYRDHHAAIGGYIFRRTGDTHATDDLLAEVFLSALRAYPRYRDRGVPIRAWLLRIATNAVNRWTRTRRRHRWLTFAGRGITTAPSPISQEGDAAPDLESAREALLALPPKHQSVLALHYLEGLSVGEVARILNISEGTVKSRLSRARDAMRRQLIGVEP